MESKIKALIYDALISGRSLEGLIDIVSSAMELPLILLGLERVVRISSGVSNEISRIVSDAIRRFKTMNIQNCAPACIPVDKYNFHIFPVPVDGCSPLGYLATIADSSEIPEEKSEFFSVFCNILVYKLKHDSTWDTGISSLQGQALLSLLQENTETQEEKIQFAFKLSPEECYSVLVITGQSGETISSDSCQELIGSIDYEAFIIYNNQPVFLLKSSFSTAYEFVRAKSELSHLLFSKSLRGGISYPFSSILSFKVYYHQALKAVEYGIKLDLDDSLTSYIDIASFDLVEQCTSSEEYSPMMLHPVIRTVIDYDKKKGTNYFRDLSAYVEQGGNIHSAARALDIKWTTMKKRINRIQDIFNIDLKDNETLSSLYFSVKVQSILYTACITCPDTALFGNSI